MEKNRESIGQNQDYKTVNIQSVELNGQVITRETLEDLESQEKKIELASKILDKWGVEALIGLVTGAGDVAGALLSIYPLLIAIKHDLPPAAIRKMSWNIGKDVLVGLVPIVGDVLDFFYKANRKNKAVFSSHLDEIRYAFDSERERLLQLQEVERQGEASVVHAQVQDILES